MRRWNVRGRYRRRWRWLDGSRRKLHCLGLGFFGLSLGLFAFELSVVVNELGLLFKIRQGIEVLLVLLSSHAPLGDVALHGAHVEFAQIRHRSWGTHHATECQDSGLTVVISNGNEPSKTGVVRMLDPDMEDH